MEQLMTSILEAVGQYGLPVALVVYFVWRDYEREKNIVVEKDKMVAHINKLQDEIRQILIKLVNETSLIIAHNSTAFREAIELAKLRPCIADELAKRILDEMSSRNKDVR